MALRPKNVWYHPKVHIEDLIGRFGEASFDLVVVSLALHHLTSPQEGLFICRRLLKHGGLFVLEAGLILGREPGLYLNTALDNPAWGSPTVWIPTDTALEGMLRFSSFQVLARTDANLTRWTPISGDPPRPIARSTFVCRAVSPREVEARPAKLAEIQDTAQFTGRINFRALSSPRWPRSSIAYAGPRGLWPMDVRTYQPNLPPQPRWVAPLHGDAKATGNAVVSAARTA
jgi:SAM-dependent methyltransferase